MRSIDLAVYADALAAESATLAARLERARGELRRAAIEREARLALPPEVVARLERLGALGAARPDGLAAEIGELQAALRALEALQAWVEAELSRTAPPGRAPAVRPDPAPTGPAAPREAVRTAAKPPAKEAAMSV